MMDSLLIAILRTTFCTALAASIARFVLNKRKARSATMHRLVWCLVLMQGWAHYPIAFALPARQPAYRSAHPNVELVGASFPRRDVDFDNSILATPVAGPPSTAFSIANCAVLAWLLGIAVVVAYFAKQYKALISNIPLGRKLTHPQWQEEWSRISDEIGVPTKTQFRLTDDVGPLCCYVPFFYLILAPERLWSSFQPTQREFILRHELAHVVRRDLWKSVAIRILALPQWFNPFAWKAVRAFDEAAEWACDDFVVLTSGPDSSEYSTTLLEIAETYFHPLRGTVGARSGVLTERVSRLVQPTFMEESRMTRLLIPAMFVLLFVAQSVRIVAAEPDQQQSQTEQSEKPAGQGETKKTATAETRRADLSRTGLVPYRVAPPDILVVQALPLTPKSPYHIQSSDFLEIVVSGLPTEKPIARTFQVDSNGMVNLGPNYDSVKVTGMTTEEVQTEIAKHLGQTEPRAEVSVTLAQASGVQQVSGEHLIGPDGFINLGVYGRTYVSGMMVAEARAAMEKQLSKHFDKPKISVDVLVYNSKFYYVVVEGFELGDHVTRLPATGNETVLDAIAQVDGLSQVSKKHMWVSRLGHGGSPDEILPVDWNAITEEADPETNYQLLPGDRVFISFRGPNEDKESGAKKDAGELSIIVPPTPVAVPSEKIPQTRGLKQATFAGPDGTFIARLPEMVVSSPTQKKAKIEIRFEVLTDANDNLVEYWGDKKGDALLVDADQLSASLRILKKNNIIKSKMAPVVTCPAGEQANLEVDGFRIAAKPQVTTDGGVLLMTKIVPGPYSEGVDTNAILGKGDTLIVRARQKENATFALREVEGHKRWIAVEDSDAVYVVLVAELQR